MLQNKIGFTSQVVTHISHQFIKTLQPHLMGPSKNPFAPVLTQGINIGIDLSPPLRPALAVKVSSIPMGIDPRGLSMVPTVPYQTPGNWTFQRWCLLLKQLLDAFTVHGDIKIPLNSTQKLKQSLLLSLWHRQRERQQTRDAAYTSGRRGFQDIGTNRPTRKQKPGVTTAWAA